MNIIKEINFNIAKLLREKALHGENCDMLELIQNILFIKNIVQMQRHFLLK